MLFQKYHALLNRSADAIGRRCIFEEVLTEVNVSMDKT